jgi:peptidoglycan/LPS O-acetylase OafA/YrhL
MTKARGQNALVDYGRFAGAIGIVLFHAKLPGGLLGLAALPLFTVFLSYFGTVTEKQAGFGEMLRERHARLMVPWYFWCIVYGAAKLADVLAGGKALGSEFHWFMLGTGPSIHLWFLPFAFVLSIALFLFVWPHRSSPKAFAVFSALAPVVSLACLSIDGDALLPPPWAQWLYVIPPAMFGIVLALAGNSTSRLAIVAAQAIATVVIALLAGWTYGLLQFAISAALASLLLLNFSPSTALSSALGRASLGIYLVHPLVISVVSRFSGGGDMGFGRFAVVLLLSLAIVLIGQRLPVLRRFF